MYRKFLMLFLVLMVSGMVLTSCDDDDDDGGTEPGSNSSITIISPNGGEVFHKGGSATLTWTHSNVENVAIEVYRGGVFLERIINSTPCDGTENMDVHPDSDLGSDYRIKIINIGNENVYDFSDEDFTIAN